MGDTARVESRVTISQTALAALIGRTGGDGEQSLERVCVRVQTASSRRCPVDTGRLRSSIVVDIEPGPVGYVGSPVEYALPVEVGTYRTRAQSYLRAGLDDVKRAGGL